MTWVRKDDQYAGHRKVAVLSDAAYRLEDEALGFCSANRTDGRITDRELLTISRSPTVNRYLQRHAQELRAAGRWHHYDDPPCTSDPEVCAHHAPVPGWIGWVIHDYLAYNPSAEKAAADAKAKAERQRRWLEAKKGRRDGTPDASPDPPQGASRDRARDASEDAAPLPPTPPRPAPKEGGAGDPAVTAAADGGRAAGGGQAKDHPVGHPPPSNGPASEQAKATIRATLAARPRAAAPARGSEAMTALRALTHDVPAFIEPGQAEPAAVEPSEESHA